MKKKKQLSMLLVGLVTAMLCLLSPAAMAQSLSITGRVLDKNNRNP